MESLNDSYKRLTAVTFFVADDHCYKLRHRLSDTNEGTILWKSMAPILQGQILFTPMDDVTTNLLINEVKTTNFIKKPLCCYLKISSVNSFLPIFDNHIWCLIGWKNEHHFGDSLIATFLVKFMSIMRMAWIPLFFCSLQCSSPWETTFRQLCEWCHWHQGLL